MRRGKRSNDHKARRGPAWSRRLLALWLALASSWLVGCQALQAAPQATPMPPEYLPTAAALTLQALQRSAPLLQTTLPGSISEQSGGNEATLPAVASASPANETAAAYQQETTAAEFPGEPGSGALASPAFTEPPSPPELAETAAPAASIPLTITLPAFPTRTPSPYIPEAPLQIYRLGELSRVVSPLVVSGMLNRGWVGPLRAELYGENGRLLARQVKAYENNPQTWADVGFRINFEISAAAEVGRLVLRVDDAFGRPMAVNSVNLILLKTGVNDLNPSDALYQKIVIQQPPSNALIQGGVVLVAGLARPNTERPLHIELIAEDGRIVGARLAGVNLPADGGYGSFAVEVPYAVTEATPVRLVVYEDGEGISDIVHLSSVEVLLSP